METIGTNVKQALTAIGQTVLRRQTVAPGQWFLGGRQRPAQLYRAATDFSF
jgi:hypothetical protein